MAKAGKIAADIGAGFQVLDDVINLMSGNVGKKRGDEFLKRIANNAMAFVNEAGGIVCRSGADTFMLYCIHIDEYKELLARLKGRH